MLDRRELLTGGALAITVGGAVSNVSPAAETLPAGFIPGHDMLVLHQGGMAAIDFLRALRADAPLARITDHAVAVLAPQGFARTTALLDSARGNSVVALLDDGDAIALEAMLHARSAAGLKRQRYRDQTLLTAHI